MSTTNVIEHGVRCSSTDVVGNPRLDEEGRPTAGSELTIDQGSVRWRTRNDIRGLRRDDKPDIGAYEYGAAQ